MCGELELGMFSGFGFVRASNRGEQKKLRIIIKYIYNSGYCIMDYFTCCNKARGIGLDAQQLKSCCKERLMEILRTQYHFLLSSLKVWSVRGFHQLQTMEAGSKEAWSLKQNYQYIWWRC